MAIIIIALFSTIVWAIDFDPRGNINMRNSYDILNGRNSTFAYYFGDGSHLTGLTNISTANVNHSNSTDYWDDLNSPLNIDQLGALTSLDVNGATDISGKLTLHNNLDMNLTNITNVDWLYVHNISGYSPIQINSNIVMSSGTNITGLNKVTADYFSGDGSLLTALSIAWSSVTGRFTHLSNFTDDLGARGYTHLGNFTDDISGTNAGDFVKLDGSAKLPAVDGSALTGIATPSIVPVAMKTESFVAIRQILDRSVTFSYGDGEYGDAYFDSTGQMNSVNTTATLSSYSSAHKTYGGYTSVSNGEASGGCDTTAGSSGTFYVVPAVQGILTKVDLYSAGYSYVINITIGGVQMAYKSGSSGGNVDFVLSDWARVAQAGETIQVAWSTGIGVQRGVGALTGTLTNATGTRGCGGGASASYVFNATPTTSGIVVHQIPSGYFSDNIDSVFIGVLKYSEPDGTSMTVKLTNGDDDTDWLAVNVVHNFTAFETQPTQLWLNLSGSGTTTTSIPEAVGWYGIEI